MEWTDDAFVLTTRPHGEASAIVTLFTRQHGRHAGLVRGGTGRRARGVLQPGNLVAARWRARLPAHLGTLTCELAHGLAAALLGDGDRLAALSAACAVVEHALPEREPHALAFAGFAELLAVIATEEDWPGTYVRWELGMLAELGFALDLSRCAATGRNDQLAYVSPRTGRAVSLSAGEPYRDRLLALPGFLLDPTADGPPADIASGLCLTGHFLERNVFVHHRGGAPAARRRLVERLSRTDDPARD
jgi:DNA repair protein RecO (recombination protein O)